MGSLSGQDLEDGADGIPGNETAELQAMGFAMVLYANTALQAAMRAMSEVLGVLKVQGDVSAVIDRLADFEERQRLVDKESYDAAEARYRFD